MKIGLLSSDFKEINKYENIEILKYIKKYFQEFTIFDVDKIEIYIVGNEVKVFYFDDKKKIDLNSYDVILIRKTRGFSEQIVDIIQAINNIKNAPLILDEPKSFSKPTSKINSLIKRHKNFNQPKTQIILNPKKEIYETILKFPVVVKPTHGRGGLAVTICNSIQEIEKSRMSYINDKNSKKEFLGYGILIQEYIDFDEEYRVNIINGKAVGSVVKKSDIKIKNANRGAKFIVKNNKKVIKLAEEIAQLHQLFFAGVDIVRKGEEYYVIECNRNPSFQEFDNAIQGNIANILIKTIYNRALEYKNKEEKSMQLDFYKETITIQNKKSSKKRKGKWIGSRIRNTKYLPQIKSKTS